MAVEPFLLVGLDEPESAELRRRLDRPVLAFETLLPLARAQQPIEPHLPPGIDARSGGVEPLHTDLPIRDATRQNPSSAIGVVLLLIPDEFVNHGVDVARLELVPEFGILGFDPFPDVAVALPGSTKPQALVPGDVGEEEGNMRRLGRGDFTGLAQEHLRHLLHDLRHLGLSGHGRVVSSSA
jgi:hypothetical protein